MCAVFICVTISLLNLLVDRAQVTIVQFLVRSSGNLLMDYKLYSCMRKAQNVQNESYLRERERGSLYLAGV